MRTFNIDLYLYSELSEKAKENALNWWQETYFEYVECFNAQEICDSMIKCIEAAGLKILDWEVGRCRGSYVVIDKFDGGNLVGKRAWAWIENNLFSQFRIPYIGDRRKAVSKYGKYYRAGMITPCPFTGYCFDEELIDALKERILKGDTIRGAFEYLAYVASKAIEREWEEQLSEPYFADHADANNFEFTIDGHFWKGV